MSVNQIIPQKGELWLVNWSYKYQPEQIADNDFKIQNKVQKLRPSLVVSGRFRNENDPDVSVAPLTTRQTKEVELFEVLIHPDSENGLTETSKILLDMVFPVDQQARLAKRIGVIRDPEKLADIRWALKLLYEIDCCSN